MKHLAVAHACAREGEEYLSPRPCQRLLASPPFVDVAAPDARQPEEQAQELGAEHIVEVGECRI